MKILNFLFGEEQYTACYNAYSKYLKKEIEKVNDKQEDDRWDKGVKKLKSKKILLW